MPIRPAAGRSVLLDKRMVAAIASSLLMAGALNAQTVQHRVLISGAGLGVTEIVGVNGNVEWSYPEPDNQNNDSWMLPNGNVIWAYQFGVKIVKPNYTDPSKSTVVWNRPTPTGAETHTCQPIDGGSSKFLIGESYNDNSAIILEVDTTGKVWRKITLQDFGTMGDGHETFRHLRKTPQGTYLVSRMTPGDEFEYDTAGKVLRTFPSGGFGAERLANGNTLISCGFRNRLIEVNPSNQIVWEVGNSAATKVAGQTFAMTCESARLPNGNTLTCNWGGDGGAVGYPVFEINAARQIVWFLPKSTMTADYSIASVKIIDTPTEIQRRAEHLARAFHPVMNVAKRAFDLRGAYVPWGSVALAPRPLVIQEQPDAEQGSQLSIYRNRSH